MVQMNLETIRAKSALDSLRIQAGLFSLASALFCLGGYILLRTAWAPSYALNWLAITAICTLYLLWLLWRGLPENRRAGERQLLGTLGAANLLTLGRGLGLAALAGFLFSPRPAGWVAWLPGVIYTLAAAADFLDGWVARATNRATRLGESLDMNLDGLGVLAAAGLVVQWGQAPAMYLSVALARYAYTGGLALWRRSGRPAYPLPPSVRRRAFAGLQMGLLVVLLWPVFGPPGTWIAAVLFALPFLAGFGYDWLYAAGLIKRSAPRIAPRIAPPGKNRSETLSFSRLQRYLPVALRLAAIALGAAHAFTLPGGGRPLATPFQAVLLLLEGAVLGFILFGAAGRTAAIAGLLLLGAHQIYASLSPAQIALAGVYIALLYLGTGARSLWTPEDRLIYKRLGEKIEVEEH
jgi:CDP-diacylglycerol--glycerol-3-phosphate 3-phosphatidyltransferase